MTARILIGNGTVLRIFLRKHSAVFLQQAMTAVDLTRAANLSVSLQNRQGDNLTTKILQVEADNIMVLVSGTDRRGVYGLTVSGTIDEADINCTEYGVLEVVSSGETSLPIGVQECETTGVYDLSYMFEQRVTVSSYLGAVESEDFALADLNRVSGYLHGQTLTVTTTEDKPYVAMASIIPLQFSQGGLPFTMNETESDGLYYYWSDALHEGRHSIKAVKAG